MYICGRNVAKEYLRTDSKIKKAYLQVDFKDEEILSLLEKRGTTVHALKKYELDNMTKENHQGVILQVEDFQYASLEDFLGMETGLFVMLDHIEDPHNFGAIIRTCEAAGVDGIIIPKDRCVDITSTVIRTSVGASKYVPIIQVSNLVQTIEKLKKDGFWFFGTDMDGEDYASLDYKGKTCLIIGNEGKGMSRIVKEHCDFIASIPMYGKINSLNASVAAGIIIYQAIFSRRS